MGNLLKICPWVASRLDGGGGGGGDGDGGVVCAFWVVGVWCLMSEFRGPGFGLLSLGFRV